MFSAPGCNPFPTVDWKRESATFTTADPDPGVPAPAALVFAFYGDRIVLADIESRGWCIPSGHIEPGETADDAMRRESVEEAGAELDRVVRLGHFILTDKKSGAIRHAPTFIASVRGLVDIPPGTESRGRQLVDAEDVAASYFAWDDLLAAVFDAAWDARERYLPRGTPLASLTEEGSL